MSTYSFAGGSGGASGFGGGGSIWGSDWARPFMDGINTGFDYQQKMRTLQTQAALDPFVVPALAAQADQTRLSADVASSTAEGQLAAILRALQQQNPGATGEQPKAAQQDPLAVAATQQAMQDQAMEKMTNPIVTRAVFGDPTAQQSQTLAQMLRMPQYSLAMPGFGGGGGYGY